MIKFSGSSDYKTNDPVPDKQRIIVVGPSWYGNWVDYFYEALISVGADARVIYTNTLFGGNAGYGSEAKMRSLEKFKRAVLKLSPRFFEFLKGIRKSISEKDLLRQLKEMEGGKRTIVVFIWTPPSVGLLKKLKRFRNTKLVYWIGEPLSRDRRWRTTLDYFDHIFLIDSPEWSGGLDDKYVQRSSLLPLSSTPKVFYPIENKDERYSCDVAFVGLYKKQRAEMIGPVKNYKFRIYGFGWEGSEKELEWLSGKLMGPAKLEDLNKIFNGAKICIGSLGIAFEGDLPTLTQRVFDIALAEGFQLSQWSPLTEKVFGDAVPLFRSTDELRELLEYYIDRPSERSMLAKKSREIALQNTWEDRAREALKIFENRLTA